MPKPINQLGPKPREMIKCYVDDRTLTVIKRWTMKTRSIGDTLDRMGAFCLTNGFNPDNTPSLHPTNKTS